MPAHAAAPTSVLLLDSRDSFTANLAHLAAELGAVVDVADTDDITPTHLRDAVGAGLKLLMIGPGPRGPAELPHLVHLLQTLPETLPVFGVCLGLQAMVTASTAGRIARAAAPIHGKRRSITHDGDGVFTGLPSPLWVMRYHSLIAVDVLSHDEQWLQSAVDDEGQCMALRHRRRPWEAVQFHPESVGTSGGRSMMANVLRRAGLDVDEALVPDRVGATPPALDVGPRLWRPPSRVSV